MVRVLKSELGPIDILNANVARILNRYAGDVCAAVTDGAISEKYAKLWLGWEDSKRETAELEKQMEVLERRLCRLYAGDPPQFREDSTGFAGAAQVMPTACWTNLGIGPNGASVIVPTDGRVVWFNGINNALKNQGPQWVWNA